MQPEHHALRERRGRRRSRRRCWASTTWRSIPARPYGEVERRSSARCACSRTATRSRTSASRRPWATSWPTSARCCRSCTTSSQDVRKLTSGTITDIADNVNKLIETNSERARAPAQPRRSHRRQRRGRDDAPRRATSRQSIKNVREITESIKIADRHDAGRRSRAPATRCAGSIDRLQTTLDNLDKTMKNMETITERIDKGRGDGRAPADRRHHRQQRRGHHRGRGQLRPRHHQAADHRRACAPSTTSCRSTFKNYLSITLMPRPDKFYLIELVEDPRGYRERPSTTVDQQLAHGSSREHDGHHHASSCGSR